MYAYAFLNAPKTKLELPTGIAGSVQIVAGTHLAALVEPGLSAEAIQNLEEESLVKAVLSHDRVICEMFRQTTLLPLRFGTCFVSLEALLDRLEVGFEEYLKLLDRLAGKAEYCLKCSPLDPPSASNPSEAKGKEYFLAKKQRYQLQIDFQSQQAQQWQWMRSAIAQSYPDAIAPVSQGNIERVYILADRSDESSLGDRLQVWQQACSHWELYLSEPLPPYHFVAEVAD